MLNLVSVPGYFALLSLSTTVGSMRVPSSLSLRMRSSCSSATRLPIRQMHHKDESRAVVKSLHLRLPRHRHHSHSHRHTFRRLRRLKAEEEKL